MTNQVVVATFYKFVKLLNLADKKSAILQYAQAHGIQGTILLATEGINGTISGSREAINGMLLFLRSEPLLADLEHKESFVEENPFYRLKVRLKKEIVTIGLSEVDPSEQVGTYVSPQEWNKLIEDPEVLVVDTRNNYEVEIGTFKQALNPHTESFREFPDYVEQNLDPHKHKKVALFCTGGIRCEKATSLMLSRGFQEVYHLKGGILKYLAETTPQESLWQGECFVFDERVSLNHGLKPGTYQLCHSCGHPLSPLDMASPQYEQMISCPHCFDTLTASKRARQEEKRKQRELEKKRQGS